MSECTADYARLMARYGAWQNQSLIAAADTLDGSARDRDGGAHFGSIRATFNHLLWGDRIWMNRFAGTPAPVQPGIPQSIDETPDWTAFKAARAKMDAAILDWTGGLDDAALSGDLSWFSGAAQRQVTRPLARLLVHMFNHQTHHRGQVHAMLTAAGARPGDTDLFLLPEG